MSSSERKITGLVSYDSQVLHTEINNNMEDSTQQVVPSKVVQVTKEPFVDAYHLFDEMPKGNFEVFQQSKCLSSEGNALQSSTQACQNRLQGHAKPIHSVCWDSSGDLLASVSEDCVRVWSLGSGSEGECVHELTCNGNKFYSCAFHPTYNSLLVIGCYQSLELWNMNENKTMTLSTQEGLIAALAVSSVTGLVASASHDKIVKLWK